MLSVMGRLLQQALTLVSLAAGVIVFSPLLFLMLVVCIVPAFIGESHFAFLGYSLAYSLTPLRRELDYLRVLGTSKVTAKEMKVFGLGQYFRDRFDAIHSEVIDRNRRLLKRRLGAGSLLSLLGSLGYYGSYGLSGDPHARRPFDRRRSDLSGGSAGRHEFANPVDLFDLHQHRGPGAVPHGPSAVLREYSIEDLHKEIGVIFQDFVRYDMTAREKVTR